MATPATGETLEKKQTSWMFLPRSVPGGMGLSAVKSY